jgi:hypothetical protein
MPGIDAAPPNPGNRPRLRSVFIVRRNQQFEVISMTAPVTDTEQGAPDGATAPESAALSPTGRRVATAMIVLAALAVTAILVVVAIFMFAPDAGAAGSCGGG